MRLIKALTATVVLTLSTASYAAPMIYDIQSHSAENYSASWLHGADHCNQQALCMSGYFRESLNGVIEGDLNNGTLSVTGGSLTTENYSANITGGSLGGFGSWFLETTLGDFWFVDLSMYGYTESDQPNSFNGHDFVLWGQNDAAYGDDNFAHMDALGLDIYAVARVPEPGTLALLAMGLVALGFQRRRIDTKTA